MTNPKIKTKVVHSQSKSAWNVVAKTLGGKYKIAQVPYVLSADPVVNEGNRYQALHHAQFISYCFNSSEIIIKAVDNG